MADLHQFGAILDFDRVSLVNVSPQFNGNISLLIENNGFFQSVSLPKNVAEQVGRLILDACASAKASVQAV
jgi:hypothetical protein